MSYLSAAKSVLRQLYEKSKNKIQGNQLDVIVTFIYLHYPLSFTNNESFINSKIQK